MSTSNGKRIAANLETITGERAKEIIEMNRRGEKPADLQPDDQRKEPEPSADLLAGDSITRFDKAKKKKKKKNKSHSSEEERGERKEESKGEKKDDSHKDKPQKEEQPK